MQSFDVTLRVNWASRHVGPRNLNRWLKLNLDDDPLWPITNQPIKSIEIPWRDSSKRFPHAIFSEIVYWWRVSTSGFVHWVFIVINGCIYLDHLPWRTHQSHHPIHLRFHLYRHQYHIHCRNPEYRWMFSSHPVKK